MQRVIETKTDLKKTDIIHQDISKALKVTSVKEITSPQEYEICAIQLQTLKGLMKQWKVKGDELLFHPREAVKTIQEFFKAPMIRMKEQETTLKSRMIVYDEKLEKERHEEQRKLDKETERKRVKKESQARAWEEKERKMREEAERLRKKGQKAEAKKLLKDAECAEEKAVERSEEAESVEEYEAIKEKAPEGISFRMKYSGKVVDFSLLPDEFKIVNQSLLNKAIQRGKGEIKIRGVVIVSEKISAIRGN